MQQKQKNILTSLVDFTFQIKKTEFLTDKDTCGIDNLTLELIDSTAFLSYPINRNNVIEGNNIIYLNGSYITFYNFFQNNKLFCSLTSFYKPVGMVGNNLGKGNVAVVTQNQEKSQLCISIYTFCQEFVPTYTIKKKVQFVDIVMQRTSFIVVAVIDLQNKRHQILVIQSKTVSLICFERSTKRLICLQQKIYVVFEQGGMHLLDTEKQKQRLAIQHSDKKIEDYCQIDNQARIMLCEQNKLFFYWVESEKEFEFDFNSYVQDLKGHRILKVGRNILVAYRNSLTLSHFVAQEQAVTFVANHIYHEKLKAGIVSVQNSQDEMHAALSVEVLEKEEIKMQNFIFNLSSISKSHRFTSPFTRLIGIGIDFGVSSPMQNALSSNSYILMGSKILNLFSSTTLQNKKVLNLYQIPKFMTVHPLGHQFLCGFDNIIKFYYKIEKEMHQIWSQQYICTAAKYSKNGSLILACIEDSYSTLILYDCYNFCKIKYVVIPCLKINITKIQWVQNSSAVILYSNSEVLKVNLFTGEKLSQFRDRKDSLIRYIQYDTLYDKAVVSTNGNILIASKTENTAHSLNSIKTINFSQEVSCIRIKNQLRTIFFGTKSGMLYWCNYPLKLKNSQEGQTNFIINQEISKLKLHHVGINSIDFTNNNKFMVVGVRGQGNFTIRVRKVKNKDSHMSGVNMNMIFQQMGNPILNSLDTSSNMNYKINKEKLKIALQKRKQSFNDLQQFRRQWQIKSVLGCKKIEIQSKKMELEFINETISKIEEIKEKKRMVGEKVEQKRKQIQIEKAEKQDFYAKQMLILYEKSSIQEKNLQQKRSLYDRQYQAMVQQCQANLNQIDDDLRSKTSNFQQNYKMMIENLHNFAKRVKIQRQQEEMERQSQIQAYINQLQRQQIQLNKISNELSIKITHCKKQYERYCNRKSFLEFKNRFFVQENEKCLIEREKLLDLKQMYQSQLKELQVYTDKKEKKLKSYLKANQALRKYKQIHESLSHDALKQAEFIREQKLKIDENIRQIQKELSQMASSNEKVDKQIMLIEKQIEETKQENKSLKMKETDINYYLKEILGEIDSIGYYKDESEKSEKLKKIYHYFYVERSVQQLIENESKNDERLEKNMAEKNQKRKLQQNKILAQLNNQKGYILSNIDVFKSYNKRINEEINLNYLQVQSQNYNLIAECNLRKQQSVNKRKILNQLIQSVKQTQFELQEMKKDVNPHKLMKKSSSGQKICQIPFILFEKEKEAKAEQNRQKIIENGLSNSSFYIPIIRSESHKLSSNNISIKKMLETKCLQQKKENSVGVRRIQTAKQKKVNFMDYPSYKQNCGVVKPFTATLKARQARDTLKSALSKKNKSSSKPSTTATFSRGGASIAY